MLGDVEPKVEVVDGALLVAHVDVEGEKVDGWEGPTAQDLEEGREPVPLQVGCGRGR